MRSSLEYAAFAQLRGRSPIMRKIMRAHNRIIPRSLIDGCVLFACVARLGSTRRAPSISISLLMRWNGAKTTSSRYDALTTYVYSACSASAALSLITYTVPPKNDTDVGPCSFNIHHPVLIICGRNVAKWWENKHHLIALIGALFTHWIH